jgi:peptide subunit release factor 1 (eRF1)
MNALQDAHARGTTLVSLYVPASRLQDVGAFLTAERAQTSNIKLAATGAKVRRALTTLQQRVRQLKRGSWALFAGEDDATGEELCVALEAPGLSSLQYRCDKQFWLDPLRALQRPGPCCAVVVVSGKGHVIALGSDTGASILSRERVHLPNKHDMGGQSAPRFERQRL